MTPRPPKVGDKVCYRGDENIYLVVEYDALVRLYTLEGRNREREYVSKYCPDFYDHRLRVIACLSDFP